MTTQENHNSLTVMSRQSMPVAVGFDSPGCDTAVRNAMIVLPNPNNSMLSDSRAAEIFFEGTTMKLRAFRYSSPPISLVLPELLLNHHTGRNMVLGTDDYVHLDAANGYDTPITRCVLRELDFQPRVLQAPASEKDAPPLWLVNRRNNHLDEDWLGSPDVFNQEKDERFIMRGQFRLPQGGKSWQEYVLSPRLHISCGEAQYLTTRYDAVTGKPVPYKRRVGLFDRKLRLIGEYLDDPDDWFQWVARAYRSIYGCEERGDLLLVGRTNLFMAFFEAKTQTWFAPPTENEMEKIANIISWNLWQSDGFHCTEQTEETPKEYFDYIIRSEKDKDKDITSVRIRAWTERSRPIKNVKV